MLKNVPHILSPALLKILAEMGHGDTIVLGDANFPAETMAAGHQIVRCDGLGIPPLLDAILRFLPLDTYVPQPVSLMETVPGDRPIPSSGANTKRLCSSMKRLRKAGSAI